MPLRNKAFRYSNKSGQNRKKSAQFRNKGGQYRNKHPDFIRETILFAGCQADIPGGRRLRRLEA